MANFRPLKQYMFHCLDRFIARYGLHGPFLEIGCGKGDVSAYLAKKGWTGAAVDFSAEAVSEATATLAPYPNVVVKSATLLELDGAFACVILWDVLEHIEDDCAALRHIETLLLPGGQLLLAVPSNPREWRWDDDFYGHFRRYTVDELSTKLADAGMTPQVFWDFTYPVFWALRRAYTHINAPPQVDRSKDEATRASALKNAWASSLGSRLLDRSAILWRPLERIQFMLFRHATTRGHEFFALARKPDV
jgi:SAM-dependent methyltransferase